MSKRWRYDEQEHTSTSACCTLHCFGFVYHCYYFAEILKSSFFLSKCDCHYRERGGKNSELFAAWVCAFCNPQQKSAHKSMSPIQIAGEIRCILFDLHAVMRHTCCALCVTWILAFFPFETIPCGNSTERASEDRWFEFYDDSNSVHRDAYLNALKSLCDLRSYDLKSGFCSRYRWRTKVLCMAFAAHMG